MKGFCNSTVYRGPPTCAKITSVVPHLHNFGLCTRKWGISEILGDPLKSHLCELENTDFILNLSNFFNYHPIWIWQNILPTKF